MNIKIKKLKYNYKYNNYIMNIIKMVVRTKTRKWGNSIGIVIPGEEVERLKLKENEEVMIQIAKKENPLKELFGTLKTKKTAEELLQETRKELESKWLQ